MVCNLNMDYNLQILCLHLLNLMWNLLLKVCICNIECIAMINPALTAESSASSAGSLLTNAAKYFMCKEQAIIAENLSAYISATTPPITILLAVSSTEYLLYR